MRLIAKKNNFSVVTSKKILNTNNSYDAILVGAGIMSGTLALLITEILPAIKILIIEKLNKPGSESTGAFNNAGTGHAANCELNYTPLDENGDLQIDKALSINRSFENSMSLWASLYATGKIDICLLYTSPSPRDLSTSRMPSSA